MTRRSRELARALVCATAVTALCTLWLARFHLVDAALVASDFGEYCRSTAALRDGTEHAFSQNRSRVTAALPALLARHMSLTDALVVGSLAATWGLVLATYVWGRALAGRLGGVCASLGFCAVGSLTLLTRTATFYPAVIAGFVAASAGAAVAARWRTPAGLVTGACGVAVALLVDVRGLLWAAPALAVVVVAACAARPRRVPGRLALVALPLVLSYAAGGWAWSDRSWTFEHQAFAMTEVAYEPQAPLPLRLEEGAYLWGWSDPRALPQTFRTLRLIRERVPASVLERGETTWLREARVDPWRPVLAGSLVIALWGLRRRPWHMVALVSGLLPFAVALQGAADIQIRLRFLQVGLAGAPVALGLAWATLVRPLPRRWRTTVAVGVGVAVLLGLVPSWFSPSADWRHPWPPSGALEQVLAAAAGEGTVDSERQVACVGLLTGDERRHGFPPAGRLGAWLGPPERVSARSR